MNPTSKPFSNRTWKECSLGVIGAGFVGSAVIRGMVEHVKEVRVYDTLESRRSHSLLETMLTDVCYMCLPTPPNDDGSCNVSAYDTVLRELQDKAADCDMFENRLFIVRSTVPVGFTQHYAALLADAQLKCGWLHSPEFLTARCALTDFNTPSRNIIGAPQVAGVQNPRMQAFFERCGEYQTWLASLYRARWPGVNVFTISSTESELCKLAMNAFFALKVGFFNDLKDLANVVGADFEQVRAGMLADGRIAHSHTQVPGPDGLPGFGGTCLPKDLANLATLAGQLRVPNAAMLGTILSNEERRRNVDPTLPQVGSRIRNVL